MKGKINRFLTALYFWVDFLKMNESQFQAENPAGKKLMPYSQQLLK